MGALNDIGHIMIGSSKAIRQREAKRLKRINDNAVRETLKEAHARINELKLKAESARAQGHLNAAAKLEEEIMIQERGTAQYQILQFLR